MGDPAADIDLSRLRIIVFDILHSLDSNDSMTINRLRRECESGLDLKANSLNGPVVKKLLTDILGEFQAVFKGLKKQIINDGCGGDGQSNFVGQKYSATEIKFIMNVVNEYISKDEEGFKDICRSTRGVNGRIRFTTDMWQEIGILIPHRTSGSIQMLVQRELMKGQFKEIIVRLYLINICCL